MNRPKAQVIEELQPFLGENPSKTVVERTWDRLYFHFHGIAVSSSPVVEPSRHSPPAAPTSTQTLQQRQARFGTLKSDAVPTTLPASMPISINHQDIRYSLCSRPGSICVKKWSHCTFSTRIC